MSRWWGGWRPAERVWDTERPPNTTHANSHGHLNKVQGQGWGPGAQEEAEPPALPRPLLIKIPSGAPRHGGRGGGLQCGASLQPEGSDSGKRGTGTSANLPHAWGSGGGTLQAIMGVGLFCLTQGQRSPSPDEDADSAA